MANLDGRFCYCSDRSNPFLKNTNWQRVQFHSFLFPISNILSHLFIFLSLHSVFWVCFSRFSLIIDLICSVNFVLFVRKADTNSNILQWFLVSSCSLLRLSAAIHSACLSSEIILSYLMFHLLLQCSHASI